MIAPANTIVVSPRCEKKNMFTRKNPSTLGKTHPHNIHVWYISLDLPEKSTMREGKYTNTRHGWYGTKKSTPTTPFPPVVSQLRPQGLIEEGEGKEVGRQFTWAPRLDLWGVEISRQNWKVQGTKRFKLSVGVTFKKPNHQLSWQRGIRDKSYGVPKLKLLSFGGGNKRSCGIFKRVDFFFGGGGMDEIPNKRFSQLPFFQITASQMGNHVFQFYGYGNQQFL